MANFGEQGKALVAEAEKKLAKKPGLLSGIGFGKSAEQRLEEGRDTFVQAANKFKAATMWDEAGDCLARCADLAKQLQSPIETADFYDQAHQQYLKNSPAKAVECLEKAITVYQAHGKNTVVAKTAQAAGELCEKRLAAFDEALRMYEIAATAFRTERSITSAAALTLRMAAIHARAERYDAAIEMYTTVGLQYCEDARLRLTARTPFFNALLCAIAAVTADTFDTALATVADNFSKYQTAAPVFDATTREHKLITKVLDAMREKDLSAFSDAVEDYNQVLALDELQHRLLLRGKHAMRAAASDVR
eukprot:TRINITY_DN21382_c0_g1_i2.p1 TRINITY_DN21382_c0_g1~~TRINITY_DN21382_c0_g1_i2.p1  ORF type:complete len:306 (+),score=50.89 TRINITY_DN21382_c0_g1_i2:80-997(+)